MPRSPESVSPLALLLDRYVAAHVPTDGVYATPIDGLTLFRTDTPAVPLPSVYPASVCAVVQGAKTVTVGDATLGYAEGDGLFVGVEVPAVGCVTRATPQRPYLAVLLALDLSLLAEVAAKVNLAPTSSASGGPFVGRLSPPTWDALARLAELIEMPEAAAVLGPGRIREIIYWLLRGPRGGSMVRFALPDGPTRRIAEAVAAMKQTFPAPIRVETLAEAASMSPSSFFAHFRTVTSMSPIQYYKQLRLLEARRLLTTGAAVQTREAAFEVGYESPSQFSREYTRMFGVPPSRDAGVAA